MQTRCLSRDVSWLEEGGDREEVRPRGDYLGDIGIQKEFKFGGWEDRINKRKLWGALRAEEKAPTKRREANTAKRKHATAGHRS